MNERMNEWMNIRIFQALTQSFGDTTIHVFDKVIVQMSIEKKTIQSSEMQLKLVRPKVHHYIDMIYHHLIIYRYCVKMLSRSYIIDRLSFCSKDCLEFVEWTWEYRLRLLFNFSPGWINFIEHFKHNCCGRDETFIMKSKIKLINSFIKHLIYAGSVDQNILL